MISLSLPNIEKNKAKYICTCISHISHSCSGLRVGITYTWKWNLNNLPEQNAKRAFKYLLSLSSWPVNRNLTTEPLGDSETPFADKMSNSRHDMNIYEIYGFVFQNSDLKKKKKKCEFWFSNTFFFSKPHAISAKQCKKSLPSDFHGVWGRVAWSESPQVEPIWARHIKYTCVEQPAMCRVFVSLQRAILGKEGKWLPGRTEAWVCLIGCPRSERGSVWVHR